MDTGFGSAGCRHFLAAPLSDQAQLLSPASSLHFQSLFLLQPLTPTHSPWSGKELIPAQSVRPLKSVRFQCGAS